MFILAFTCQLMMIIGNSMPTLNSILNGYSLIIELVLCYGHIILKQITRNSIENTKHLKTHMMQIYTCRI